MVVPGAAEEDGAGRAGQCITLILLSRWQLHGVAGSFKIFTEMSNSVLVYGHNWRESIRERTVHLDLGCR